MPPMTLNLLRWSIALRHPAAARPRCTAPRQRPAAQLAPLRPARPAGHRPVQLDAIPGAARARRRINVTLVASGMPVWMLLVGRFFYDVPVKRRQIGGAVLSIAGVLVVCAAAQPGGAGRAAPRGGRPLMIVATIVWSFYSWSLMQKNDVPALRAGLGCLPAGPGGIRRAVVGGAGRRRMGAGHAADRLELAPCRRPAVPGDRAGDHRHALLGRGCPARRARDQCVLHQSDAAVYGAAVGRIPGRTAAVVPRARPSA